MGAKPVFETADLDSLVHLCETAHLSDPDLPGPPYHLYERPALGYYEAYVLPLGEEESKGLEYVGEIEGA